MAKFKRQFSVVKSKLPFVGIGVDHAGGLRGIATNINARNRFFAIVPLICYLCETPAVTAKHHNTSPAKTEKQEFRINKIVKGIELHQNPFSPIDTGTLRNMYTNAVVNDQYIDGIVNVTTYGAKSLVQFTRERLMVNWNISPWATVKRSKIPNFHAAMTHKSVKSSNDNRKIERNLLAKFIIASRSSRDIDEEGIIGNYELNAYPPSLMVHTTLHECKDKSDLGNVIWKMGENYKECTNDVDIQNIAQRCLIFDGMAIVRSLKKESWVKTCTDLAKWFIQKVEYYFSKNDYHIICIEFNPYTPSQLPKIVM